MNLTTARSFVRQFARNAGDSSMYSDADVDRAIQAIADDFILDTRCLRTTDTLVLTADDDAADLSAMTDFRPERRLKAWLTLDGAAEGRVTFVDHDAILDKQIDCPQTGLPTHVGFTGETDGVLYPTPDDAYTLHVQYLIPFTSWTPGDADPGTLNLPDDYLRTILMYGATAMLQHNEPSHTYARDSWAKYLDFRQRMRGAGGMGAAVIERQREE